MGIGKMKKIMYGFGRRPRFRRTSVIIQPEKIMLIDPDEVRPLVFNRDTNPYILKAIDEKYGFNIFSPKKKKKKLLEDFKDL